jgi:hypothetical protein
MRRLKGLVQDLVSLPNERLDDEDRVAQRNLIHWSHSYQQRVRAIRRTQTPDSRILHKPEHIAAALSEVDRFCDQVAALIAGGNAQTVH